MLNSLTLPSTQPHSGRITPPTPNYWSLNTVMKCKLLLLYIPLRGMRQLPYKLERRGLVPLFSPEKGQLANMSGAASSRWLARLPGYGDQREATAAVSPGWSASRLRPRAPLWSLLFLTLLWLFASESVCLHLCGPSGCCQADHGSCCESAQLTVSTYIPLSPPPKKGR